MRVLVLAGIVAAAAVLAGCQVTDTGTDLVNGKQLFVAKCAACHTLARANAKGMVGPDLDAAFQRAREDGFGQTTFEGIVHRQILEPARRPQHDPVTGREAEMPPKLVTGEDAEDVAAYVASAAAKGGKDTGALARVGAAEAKGTAKEKDGTLTIPADPGGATAYQFANADAQPGQVTIRSPNESSVDHDISLEGNGVNEKGDVVSNGGVSEFQVDLEAGEYTFYCSVDAHRQAGMEGKLTVK
jgi:mono/diheme cytochrome c family protein